MSTNEAMKAFSDRTSELLEDRAARKKVHVFISYNHRDSQIAEAVKDALTIFDDRVHCFLDYQEISKGDDWEEKIEKELFRADWYVFIYTGGAKKNYDYCIYEAGQFRGHMRRKLASGDRAAGLCCLYDTVTLPKTIRGFQGTRVSAKDWNDVPLDLAGIAGEPDYVQFEKTHLFKFFTHVLSWPPGDPIRDDITSPAVRKLIGTQVRQVTRTFIANRSDEFVEEFPLQPRVRVRLPPAPEGGWKLIDDKAVVEGYENALAIFGLAMSVTDWGRLKSACKLKNDADAPWIVDIDRAICRVSGNDLPERTEVTFRAKNSDQVYRPILSRYELFESGTRDYYITFVESRGREFALTSKLSPLITALILALRFKQQVFQYIDIIRSGRNLTDSITRLEKDISAIETESYELGFGDPQLLLNCYDDLGAREEVRQQILDYEKRREVIDEAITSARSSKRETQFEEIAGVLVDHLEAIRNVNGRFIRLTTEAFLARADIGDE